MRIVTFLLVIFIFTFADANARFEPAKMRSDGNLIDDVGNIIGVRNRSDDRTTKHEYYYYGVEDGRLTNESKYRVMYHPEEANAGLVRIDLEEEQERLSNPQQQQQTAGSKTRTTSIYNKDLDKSRYDVEGANAGTRY